MTRRKHRRLRRLINRAARRYMQTERFGYSGNAASLRAYAWDCAAADLEDGGIAWVELWARGAQ